MMNMSHPTYSNSNSTVPLREGGARMGQEDLSPSDDIFSRFDSKIFMRLWEYVAPYRLALSFSLVAILLFAMVQVSIPLTIRFVVDSAVTQDKSHLSFNTALAIFGTLVALNFLLNFLQEWTTARIAQEVIFNLRRAMFFHLQKVSLSLLDKTQVGRLMARLQGDVNSLQEFMENSISALGDLFLLLGIMIALLAMNLKLGLLTLTVLPFLVFVRIIWLPWARRVFMRARETSSAVSSVLAENINGIRTVQESRREKINFDHYEIHARENLNAQINSSRASQIMVPTVDVLTGLAMAVIVIVGGSAVLNDELAIGVMVAYLFYVQRFFDPIRTLSMQYTVLQRAMAAGHRIFEVLDLPVYIEDKPNAQVLTQAASPHIEFRNVSFGYQAGHKVLHNINLNIPEYSTVALVGPTGSGKTSITALIHRFYDVWQGQVLIDGKDVRDLSLDSLGKHIGMVLQDPFLFSGTILDNLRYGLPLATNEQIITATKAVSAHDFIIKLPQGYDTQVGQRGRNLSIGQRQLISFARTLLTAPKILILDEATANIDSFTEQAIQSALKVLCEGRTTIVIAHRLATIREADLIVVLNKGSIIEQGTHNDLLNSKELYYQLNQSSQLSFSHH